MTTQAILNSVLKQFDLKDSNSITKAELELIILNTIKTTALHIEQATNEGSDEWEQLTELQKTLDELKK